MQTSVISIYPFVIVSLSTTDANILREFCSRLLFVKQFYFYVILHAHSKNQLGTEDQELPFGMLGIQM